MRNKKHKLAQQKLNDLYDRWVTSGGDTEVFVYLGMTKREYNDWMAKGTIPRRFLDA